eukprot:1344870-Prymnesium_polylepis.1
MVDLKTLPVLRVEQKFVVKESAATHKARRAALARWRKDTACSSAIAHAPRELRELSAPADATREWRRGESPHVSGKHQAYTNDELAAWARKLHSKEVKWTEYQVLYKDSKVRVPPATLKSYFYGYNKHLLAGLLDGSVSNLRKPGPKRGLLTKEQEDFGLGLAVEMAHQRKPLAPEELVRWAHLTAQSNGTKDVTDDDMRKWLKLFGQRASNEHNIDIHARPTQQLSTARKTVLLSGVRAFETTINGLLSEEPVLAAQGLKATGDWDETKLDINSILQGAALVPDGAEAQWE